MIAAIIQARMGSTRFPNKVLEATLAGQPLMWHVIERLKPSRRLDKIVLATSENPKDDVLARWATERGIAVVRGSENDVLARYALAAKSVNATTVVRITADDPFKDYEVLDRTIDLYLDEGLDFAFNNRPPTFPEGLDIEVFSRAALDRAHLESVDPFEREHMTQYLFRHPELFKQGNLAHDRDLSSLRWTLDTQEDYLMAKTVYDQLYKTDRLFLMRDILELLERRPEIASMNSNVARSLMYKK